MRRRTAEAVRGLEDPGSVSSSAPVEEGQEPAVVRSQPMEILSPDEQLAGHLRDTVPSLFMFASMIQPFKQISEGAYKLFRERLLADCNASDPIEVMLVEQLALAHFNMGLLHCKAANARQVEAVGVYSGAAARLMAEFRRSALGLQAFRAASRQLAAESPRPAALPLGDLADFEDLPEKIIISTEMESTRSDDDEEPIILPMLRAATV
jgi:hypothetical protein